MSRLDKIKKKYSGETHWEGCADEHDMCWLIQRVEELKEALDFTIQNITSIAEDEGEKYQILGLWSVVDVAERALKKVEDE